MALGLVELVVVAAVVVAVGVWLLARLMRKDGDD